ncbi:MAG: hypothetical protein ABSG78_04455 [Verrucomicrobiota bacterium]|jgi:hypothetical protein
MNWKRLLVYSTGSVDQELLLFRRMSGTVRSKPDCRGVQMSHRIYQRIPQPGIFCFQCRGEWGLLL